jgi:hypothetical protein
LLAQLGAARRQLGDGRRFRALDGMLELFEGDIVDAERGLTLAF